MASKTRRLLTNFSKGELSPLLEGRPDLAAYFEGASVLTNWYLLRQGGVTRRPGTRFIAEVKDSADDTILFPFEASVDNSYIIEVGDLYFRFFKNKLPIKISAGAPPLEVVTPYTPAVIRGIHFTQSVDVLFLFEPVVPQRTLSRFSDTSWSLDPIVYTPPPSFEADTDISDATATLTPGATSGNNVLFTASAAKFLEADVGRQIIFGSAKATIISFGASAGDTASPNDHVRANIVNNFPNTDPIPAGSWLLRLSPQSSITVSSKAVVGQFPNVTADKPTWRSADVNKFIHIFGGVLRIANLTSATAIATECMSDLVGSADPPVAAIPGAWTQEITSWSNANGFPRTGEFFQGRLAQAGTAAQPTTWWLSASDSFERYAVGTLASDALEYTIATRALNTIMWLCDNVDMFIGTAGAEHRARGSRDDQPLGGDSIPTVTKISPHGVAPIQPVVIGRRILFVDRSQRQIFAIGFDLEEDGFAAFETTGAAEHVTTGGVKSGPLGFAKRPDPRIYFVRNDGQLITLTYFQYEKVIGFTRLITDGIFEAVAVIPQAAPLNDQVWVIVRRTINGQTKRYVEMFEDNATEMAGRSWLSLQTDCAKLYDLNGTPTTVLTGLSHLEGKVVDIVADGVYVGQKTVASGQITMDASASQHVEVGLHYDSIGTTMRPAVEGAMIEGLPRGWIKLWLRLKDAFEGTLGGQRLVYPAAATLFTGDINVTGYGDTGVTPDSDGRITFTQDRPYPMTVLAVFGELAIGDHG